MRTVPLFSLVLIMAAMAAPAASAVHECTTYYYDVAGVEAYVCLDDEGRPHDIFVKDETLGGVMLGHPLFSDGHELWGNDFQYTHVLVYTYANTPTGQTWVHPFYWCGDADGDGFCDDTWIGASTYFRGFFNQVHLDRSPGSGTWSVCALTSVTWRCMPLPVQPPVDDGLPAVPSLP